jgi:hypothetical protein
MFARSLLSMNSLKLNKYYMAGESLPTINSIKEILTHMVILLVVYKRSIQHKSFPTVNVSIWSFPTVNPVLRAANGRSDFGM